MVDSQLRIAHALRGGEEEGTRDQRGRHRVWGDHTYLLQLLFSYLVVNNLSAGSEEVFPDDLDVETLVSLESAEPLLPDAALVQ